MDRMTRKFVNINDLSYSPKRYSEKISTDEFGTFSNLCERRLAFELCSFSNPPEVSATLIHHIIDVSGRKGKGFINCSELYSVFKNTGVDMTMKEVEVLATGFASNGEGGINGNELCNAIKTLMYQLKGEFSMAEERKRSEGMAAKAALEEENEVDFILITVCESVLARERTCGVDTHAYLSQDPQAIFDSILKPFSFFDDDREKKLTYENYCNAMYKLGARLPPQDLHIVAKRYAAKLSKPAHSGGRTGISVKSSVDDDESFLATFRNQRLQGTLLGTASSNPSFQNWLSTQSLNGYRSGIPSRGIGLEGRPEELGPSVEYVALVQRLTEIMDGLREEMEENDAVDGRRHGRGLLYDGNKNISWIFRDFPIIDCLLTQLEKMSSGERRRTLMTLQYAFASADQRNIGEVDGFSILEALKSAGFVVTREDRVRILRTIEELGGTVDYSELCQVLIRSCADWTETERTVVFKILKAMGITVLQRRTWLAALRQELLLSDAHEHRSRERFDNTAFSLTSHHKKLQNTSRDMENDHGISPSTFLRCLRHCGVELTVEEEAILLDCLDMERLAEHGVGNTDRGSNWSVPLIYYKSFLSYCSRHCGHWSDISPEVAEALKHTLTTVTHPQQTLQEFAELLHSFDELSNGEITSRSFLVACHRSRLLANFDESSAQQLSKVLLAEGGGVIKYIPFVMYLKAQCFGHTNSDNTNTLLPSIGRQLIENCQDAFGTLLPLRNWLLHNTEAGSSDCITFKELVALLRENSVQYKSEDLESFIADIKTFGMNKPMTSTTSNASHLGTAGGGAKIEAIHGSSLFRYLLNLRGSWIVHHQKLAERLHKMLSISGANRFSPEKHGSSINLLGKSFTNPESMSFSRTFRGVESAAARLILARLHAFSELRSSNKRGNNVTKKSDSEEEDGVDGNNNNLQRSDRFVDRDIFGQVLRAVGIPLTDEDILALADATDPSPAAGSVACDVILDVLSIGQTGPKSNDSPVFSQSQSVLEEQGMVVDTRRHPALKDLTKAGLFGLKHLQDLIWTSGTRFDRTALEWIADVRAVFKGFDPTDSGFIPTEDFVLALQLLNASVSTGILRDISLIPDGPGMIPYKELLEIVLQLPRDSATLHYAENQQAAERELYLESAIPPPDKLLEKNRSSPVTSLIHVVRKNLYQFIVSNDNLEKAWMCMLQVFKRFDPQENNVVSPRDFCLAVAVLIEEDDVLLTKEDWTEIIEYFATTVPVKTLDGSAHTNKLQVDYMKFCDCVLDSHELSGLKWSSSTISKQSSSPLSRSQQSARTTSATNKGKLGASSTMKPLNTKTAKKFGLSLRVDEHNPEGELQQNYLVGIVGQHLDVRPNHRKLQHQQEVTRRRESMAQSRSSPGTSTVTSTSTSPLKNNTTARKASATHADWNRTLDMRSSRSQQQAGNRHVRDKRFGTWAAPGEEGINENDRRDNDRHHRQQGLRLGSHTQGHQSRMSASIRSNSPNNNGNRETSPLREKLRRMELEEQEERDPYSRSIRFEDSFLSDYEVPRSLVGNRSNRIASEHSSSSTQSMYGKRQW